MLSLICGTTFIMWLAEQITAKGIGNGSSMIIFVNIVSNLPMGISSLYYYAKGGEVAGILKILGLLVILLAVIVFIVIANNGERRIPVQYAKRVVGRKMYGGQSSSLPMKLNMSGVMPIIFAQALMMFPLLLSRFDASQGLAATLSDYTGFWYNFIFAILVVAFTYFYTAVTVNPTMMAEEMKKNGGFIPGVKPGKKTADYLDAIMSRITLPGSLFLAIVAILPAFAMMFGINNQFSQFYGGTSLLILVGVVLDTLQQIESHLLMRHYDGLMKTGRLKGRSGM